MTTGPSDELSLPAVAAQLAALRARVGDLSENVRTVKARVEAAGVTGGGIKLREQVAELARAVAELQDNGGEDDGDEDQDDDAAPRVTAPVWTGPDDPKHEARLVALTKWVNEFLLANYPHVTLRPCWAAHMAAVWELSTLRAEHTRVYTRKRPSLDGALTFHDRWLPGVADRLALILKDCKGTCALRARVPGPARPQVR